MVDWVKSPSMKRNRSAAEILGTIEARRARRGQMSFFHYDLEAMVPKDHAMRKMKAWLPVEGIALDIEELKKGLGREGYGWEVGVRALFLQFHGDHSDREMEEQLRFNMLYRWFCGFNHEAPTPDHTYFCRVRKELGAERIKRVFEGLMSRARERKLVKGMEKFVDASAFKRMEATWAERDAAVEAGEPEEKKQGNAVISKYAADTEARWGCKGHDRYWFGYKRHVSVDLGCGLIERIHVTPGNVADGDGFRDVCPTGGVVLADKAYDSWKVRGLLKERGCEDGIIRKYARTAGQKNRNKVLTKMRSPGERVFSKMSRRTRYMGVKKTLLQALWEGIVHNVKRLVVICPEPAWETV